jgi:hypothetical protein
MDTIAIITVIYIAVWIGVYKDNIKRDFGLDKPTEQTQQKEETK